MRKHIQAVIVLGLLFAGCLTARPGSLSFQTPGAWKSLDQPSGGTDSYAFTNKAGNLLMFSPWPPPSKPEDIPALVRQLSDRFVKDAKNAQALTNVSFPTYEYRISQFSGPHCNGSYVTFEATVRSTGTKIWQAKFLMSVDGLVWNGQFTGPPAAWEQALAMLKSTKKDD